MPNDKDKAEEEDLDDLDDVLDKFITPQPPSKSAAPPSSSAPAVPSGPTPEPDDVLSEDFAKHLAAEMEAMMRQLSGEEASVPSGSGDSLAGIKTQQADIEANEGDSKQNIKEGDPFQKVIRQAMEKLQESDDTLKADSQGSQDTLESLLASLGDLNLGDEGPEGGENLESMLETMMSQLMSKEILYEPLKELDTKYPEYLSNNSSTLSPEDLSRYTDQKARVSQIVALFENPSYSDDNPAQSAEILRLMNEMQSYGSPPSEIMGAMPPGFDLGADGLPNVPEGCVIA